jgi:hypothetical protein
LVEFAIFQDNDALQRFVTWSSRMR